MKTVRFKTVIKEENYGYLAQACAAGLDTVITLINRLKIKFMAKEAH